MRVKRLMFGVHVGSTPSLLQHVAHSLEQVLVSSWPLMLGMLRAPPRAGQRQGAKHTPPGLREVFQTTAMTACLQDRCLQDLQYSCCQRRSVQQGGRQLVEDR